MKVERGENQMGFCGSDASNNYYSFVVGFVIGVVRRGGPSAGSPTEAEVFVYSDPCMVDVLGMAGGEHTDRREWRTWTSRPSDVEGCVNLFDPAPLRPTLPLRSPRVLILALLDALDRHINTDRKRHAQ